MAVWVAPTSITASTTLVSADRYSDQGGRVLGLSFSPSALGEELGAQLAAVGAWVNLDGQDCSAVRISVKNLRSVVCNLLSNAVKYCRPDRVPHVAIRCQVQGDYDVLKVQGNGLGACLSRGQGRFFAMVQRLYSHVEGSGIGLYMVKKIRGNAGVRIEVENHLGQGSTFRVHFPVP